MLLHLGIHHFICLSKNFLGILSSFFSLGLGWDGVMSDTSKESIKHLGENGEMGRNPIHIEMIPIKIYKEAAWTYLREGRLVSFMQCTKGYDETISM